MKLPRFSVREMAMLVLIALLSVAWWADRRESFRQRDLAELHRLTLRAASGEVERLKEERAECREGLERAEAEARESAGPR